MGCNCGKKSRRVETKVIMGEPEPLPQEIVELTEEEIDHFNNIDIIEPIEDGE
jgi:hypothetical protein